MELAKLFESEVGKTKRIFLEHFPSVIGWVMNKTGKRELTQELVYALVEAIENVCFGGIEPDWPSIEAYEFWTALTQPDSVKMFDLMTEEQRFGPQENNSMWGYNSYAERRKLYPMHGGKCPYKDKKIPYMSWSVEVDEKLSKNGAWSKVRSLAFECAYAEPFYPG